MNQFILVEKFTLIYFPIITRLILIFFGKLHVVSETLYLSPKTNNPDFIRIFSDFFEPRSGISRVYVANIYRPRFYLVPSSSQRYFLSSACCHNTN